MQRVSRQQFVRVFDSRGLARSLTIRASQVLMAQAQQSVLCRGMHSSRARLSRFLLMLHDRARTDTFSMTQQFITMMLGSDRTTVNIATCSLQQSGLIRYRRGAITVENRAGLELASCECYFTLRNYLQLLMPELPSIADAVM